MTVKKEYGDFQTPAALAATVTRLVSELYGRPEIVIEPTAGLGAFLHAAQAQWSGGCEYEGYEINPEYVSLAAPELQRRGIGLVTQNFFSQDWKQILRRKGNARVLVLGRASLRRPARTSR